MSDPSIPTLTSHLLSLSPSSFTHATQTPFLSRAGNGTLEKGLLQKWLSQDRLYAQAYIRFAALLLANVKLPAKIDSGAFEEGLLDLLLDSINNVRRELKFFEDVAQRYELDINAEEEDVSEGVKLYRKLFFETGEAVEAGKVGMLEGLVLLWGTEKCYLEAWRYAASHSPATKPATEDADGGALRKEFVPNWTSDEFVVFVDKIGEFLDMLWEREGVEKKKGVVDAIWRRVLDVESVFWPVVE